MKSLFLSFSLLVFSFTLFAQTPEDKQAIQNLVKTMAEGWTAGSGEQIASVFAAEHDFVVWNGYYMKNMSPKLTTKSFDGILSSIYKDTQHFATIDKIKFIRKDVALIHVFAAIAKKGEGRPADPEVLWTGLLTKENGSWKIVSFHNLDLEVFENEETRKRAPMPTSVMYAGWYSENK